ncbi:MAG: hypothetical protein LC737_09675 [Chloroflexi bacterium]|nr:hypothetical protein [Chloroflexota bacterium]
MAAVVFNGKTYNSVDEMPPDARNGYEQAMSVFADKNQNGVPDIFEGKNVAATNFTTSTIIYEGKTYNSADELPPEAKAKYDAALKKLGGDVNKDGIADALEDKVAANSQSKSPVVSVNTVTMGAPPNNVATHTTTSSNLTWLVLTAFLLAVIAALVVMWILK